MLLCQKAKNKVATAFGVSSNYYGGHKRVERNLFPIQGIGQGNGAGPIRFVSVSSPGIALMALKGFQAILTACMSLMVLIIVCFMFVDNDQIQITATTPKEPAETVLPCSQQALDYWVGYLGSIGGAINPEKSYWCMLDWHWSRDQWKPRLSPDMTGNLTAVNPSGDRKPLTCLELSHASIQLGIHSAPDGNQRHSLTIYWGKAQDFAANLRKQ